MTFFLDDLILAPINGLVYIGRKIHEMAVDDLLGEDGTRQQLRELYMKFELGDMTEKEFEKQEEELIDRLDEIQALKKQHNSG